MVLLNLAMRYCSSTLLGKLFGYCDLAEAQSVLIPSSIETDLKLPPTVRGGHYTQNQIGDV